MDIAATELTEFLTNDWFGISADYYMNEIAKIGKEKGDTALHRLCGQRVRASAIQTFLKHYQHHLKEAAAGSSSSTDNSWSPSSSSSYKDLSTGPPDNLLTLKTECGATALHIAIMRDSWEAKEIVKMLLEAAPTLASIPLQKCGSYPLHILLGQTTKQMDQDYFQMLLEAYPDAVLHQDIHGETPLSVFYKNVVRTCCWARQMDWDHVESLDEVLQSSSECTDLVSPLQYIDFSLQLIHQGRRPQQENKIMPVSWQDVCLAPRCPPLLVRLLLLTNQLGSLHQPDAMGRLPLHCAAAAPEPMSTKLVFEESSSSSSQQTAAPAATTPTTTTVKSSHCKTTLVELLACPRTASHQDSTGRLPLHYAVTNPALVNGEAQHVQSIVALANASPMALDVRNPCTNLYPLHQLAATMTTTTTTTVTSGGHVSHKDSSSSSLSGDATLQVCYHFMRASPNVINYHR